MDTPTTQVDAGRRSMDGRDFLLWAATLVTFPIAGLAAHAVLGPIHEVWEAVVAGAIAGAVVGAGQRFALRRMGADVRWIAATAAGLAIGLGLAIAMFDYGTTVGDLAVVGAVSGLGVGAAQWFILRGLLGASIVWIPTVAILWAIGWSVTTAIGVDPELRWAVFGLSGAATMTLLTGAVLWVLSRVGLRASATA